MTRHGAGPFPTYSDSLTQSLVDVNNPENAWQGAIRSGFLDLRLLNYALQVNGPVDYLAVTHFDCVTDNWGVATASDTLKHALKKARSIQDQEAMTAALFAEEASATPPEYLARHYFLDYVEQMLQTKIGIVSSGPRYADKRFVSYPVFAV